jgi:putative FmdB family regulatory protein
VPLYEYLCPHCGRFETIRKFSDPLLTACPTCGRTVEKLASAPAIQFKGTGWYITDYARKDNNKEAGKGENGAKSSTESKESKDTKSAPKAESKTESSSSKSEKSSSASSSTST